MERAALHREHILDAADNVKARLPQEAEVACAQPRHVVVGGNGPLEGARAERLVRELGQIPVAGGDRVAAEPNLADGAVGENVARLVVDNGDAVAAHVVRHDVVAACLEDVVAQRRALRHGRVADAEPASVDHERGHALGAAAHKEAVLGEAEDAGPRARREADGSKGGVEIGDCRGADGL